MQEWHTDRELRNQYGMTAKGIQTTNATASTLNLGLPYILRYQGEVTQFLLF